MASNRLKTPPVLVHEDSYDEWKGDLAIWQLYTDLDKKKQGPAVYLMLSGRARECVRDLKIEDIGAIDGVKKITDKLDTLFEKDINTQTYLAFKEFYEYRRPSGVSITEFLVHYEYLYHKLAKYDNAIPEGVQAFFVLTAANISEENEKLARASCGLMTYPNMKECIQKIFGDPSGDGTGSTPSVKSEPVFHSDHYEDVNYTSGFRGWRGQRRGGRGHGFGTFNRSQPSGTSYRKNPVDRDGNLLKCFKCGATDHFARSCQSKRRVDREFKTEEIHITLFNGKSDTDMAGLVGECFGKALLDSACTKTVCGETWMRVYLETLDDSDLKLVETVHSDTKFRFGDGIEIESLRLMKIPATIGDKRVIICTDVVSSDIPLLMSRSAMNKSNMVLCFVKDTVKVLGTTIRLESTFSGHYCMPLTNKLLDSKDNCNSIVLHSSALKECSKSDKKKKAIKLHRQFSHASKEKLCKLAKESGNFNDDEFLKMIEEWCDSCEICQKYKRAPLRPVVGLPLADRFNQVVCMDLKEYIHNKVWILHLIDGATRYSAASLITTKHQDEILRNIYLMWISYFGYPRKFMSDNGGEFSNEKFREMNEKLNIETATTAAESPFSNGMVERHNLVLAEAMHKTIDDVHCEPKVALAWAVCAKNSLQSHNGFSPNHLVFGHNVNIPSVLIDKLPALESSTSSDIIRENMTAMHVARQKFIEAESSEKIRRALRHKVRSYADVKYSNGDRIYYKRKNFKGWKGPAIVLGQDGQFVLVRHGGAYFRVHPCQLMKIGNECTDVVDKECVVGGSSENNILSDAEQSVKSHVCVYNEDDSDDDNQLVEMAVGDANVDDISDSDDHSLDPSLSNNIATWPKRNSFVRYKLGDSVWKNAKVLSVQPKQTGKCRNWINVHVTGEEEPISVNWDDVELWNELPYPEDVILLTRDGEYTQEVVDAKDREINNLKTNDVYEVVPYSNQKTVSSRWVLTEKYKDGERTVKACLVARGFEEDSSSYRKDSPTCARESLRLVFVTAALMCWKLESIDVTAAFLQGGSLKREVLLKPPPDVCSPNMVWRLRRCIYGLNDAPRYWYKRVREVLMNLGAVLSAYDNALYLWFENDKLIGMLVSHVDDFAFCGNQNFHNTVIKELKSTFKISAHEAGTFKYLGLSVEQSSNGVVVNQENYISSITPVSVPKNRYFMRKEELNSDEKSKLKRLSGQMLWVSSQTRPDLSFETCIMGNTGKGPTMNMIHEANKAVLKLKSKRVDIKFPGLGNPAGLRVISYSDATYNSLPDGSSQGGYVVFLMGENGKVAPIRWQSKKLARVTKSPLASETLALGEAADAGFLIACMVQEIFRLSSLPMVECFTDNASLVETLKTSKLTIDTRLRVDISRLREMISQGEICASWVEGRKQLADALTKRGASTVKLLDILSSSNFQ